MRNKNRHKRNQPPMGQGKRQSRFLGGPLKLSKRSEVAQARRGHPELNIGSSEMNARSEVARNPKRPKAGR